MKNSNDTIGNQTRELLTCSAVPQPTALPRAPGSSSVLGYKIYTYLLTPWSRVLPEKLTSDFAPSQEIPRIYGTRKSLTVPISARHLSLS
jgi:hypothetical protein